MIKMSTIKREGHTCQEYGTCRLPSSPPWSCSCQPIYCYFSQQGVWNGGKGQEKDLDLFLTSLQMIREQMKPVMERRLEVLSQGCRSSSSSWAPVTTKTRTGTTSPQDMVSYLMHNAVAMCQQNSDASQDAPKDLIDS